MKKANRIAIVGATGMVGKAFLSILEEKFFVNAEIDLLASKKSEGKKVTFRVQNMSLQILQNMILAIQI